MRTLITLASLIALSSVTSSVAGGAAVGKATTARVSVSSSGAQAVYNSYAVGISAGGRYVAFSSESPNLVRGDTNRRRDAFVRDVRTGTTRRVSVDSRGRQGTCADRFGCSDAAGISADGRYVVFVSEVSTLVGGDRNRAADVFVHDRKTGRTIRASVSSTGREADRSSGEAAISADGRYVAFESAASNLVAGDTNHALDVFVRDLRAGRTTRLSVSSRGGQAIGDSEGPALSANGRYVAFYSNAANLVAGDTNDLPDVFVHDRRTGRTSRVSLSSRGRQATGDRTNNGSNAPAISADGRFVAFHSAASSLVPRDTNRAFDIFVHDRATGTTRRVSVSSRAAQANAESLGPPSISPDGRYVAFASLASNLVPGDANKITDVFVRDLRSGRTILASLGSRGEQSDDGSANAVGAFSVNARYLAFSSWGSNLVPGDTNGCPDAFVRDFGGPPTG